VLFGVRTHLAAHGESMHKQFVPQLVKMLNHLSTWLDLAEAYAEERGFDAEVLLSSRLSPDQFALSRQIQAACDAAKFLAGRCANAEIPSHPDTETTIAQLRERIASTVQYIESIPAEAYSDTERQIFLPFLKGGSVTALDYAVEFAFPNFHFHVVMTYAILRHNGVALGKRAYIGSMTVTPPAG
jgi:hypothetical protein